MNMKIYMINNLIKWLLGGELFNQIKALVVMVSTEDISGDEKRKKVYNMVKGMAGGAATFLINLGIEAAVLWLKSKEGQVN